jgi:hypothetical protein
MISQSIRYKKGYSDSIDAFITDNQKKKQEIDAIIVNETDRIGNEYNSVDNIVKGI